jgi:hypothetical protein
MKKLYFFLSLLLCLTFLSFKIANAQKHPIAFNLELGLKKSTLQNITIPQNSTYSVSSPLSIAVGIGGSVKLNQFLTFTSSIQCYNTSVLINHLISQDSVHLSSSVKQHLLTFTFTQKAEICIPSFTQKAKIILGGSIISNSFNSLSYSSNFDISKSGYYYSYNIYSPFKNYVSIGLCFGISYQISKRIKLQLISNYDTKQIPTLTYQETSTILSNKSNYQITTQPHNLATSLLILYQINSTK